MWCGRREECGVGGGKSVMWEEGSVMWEAGSVMWEARGYEGRGGRRGRRGRGDGKHIEAITQGSVARL